MKVKGRQKPLCIDSNKEMKTKALKHLELFHFIVNWPLKEVIIKEHENQFPLEKDSFFLQLGFNQF